MHSGMLICILKPFCNLQLICETYSFILFRIVEDHEVLCRSGRYAWSFLTNRKLRHKMERKLYQFITDVCNCWLTHFKAHLLVVNWNICYIIYNDIVI